MEYNPYSYRPTFEPLLHQAATKVPALRKMAKNPFAQVLLGNPDETDRANKLNVMAVKNQPMSKEDQDWQRKRLGSQIPAIGGITKPGEWEKWYLASKKAADEMPMYKLMSSPTMNYGTGGTMNPEQARKFAMDSAKRLQEFLDGKR
jgi:hypothetical protein